MRDEGNKVFRYLVNLSNHVDLIKDYEKGLRKDLTERLLFKNKMNETYNVKIKDLENAFEGTYGEMKREIVVKNQKSDKAAKKALDEIIHLKTRVRFEGVNIFRKMRSRRIFRS
jgi:hypothetical protein